MIQTTCTKQVYNDTTDEWDEVVTAYLIDGVEVSQEVWEAALPGAKPDAFDSVGVGMLGAKNCSAWPILSDGFAVDPSQVEEAREHCKAIGTPCDFLPDGRAVFTSQRHQREVLRAHHMIHRNDNAGGQSRTYKRQIGREEYI